MADQEGEKQPTMMEKMMGMATSAATTAMAKAQEIDAQYKVTEKVQQAAEVTIKKAAEIDEKYQVTTKAKTLAQTTSTAAVAVDQKLGVSAAVTTGVAKAQELDQAYGVSTTITTQAKAVDAKLGITTTAASLDEKYGVTATATKASEMAKGAALATHAKVTSMLTKVTYQAFLGDEEVQVVLQDGCVKIGPADAVKIEPTSTVAVTECVVNMTMGADNTVLTFTSAEDAAAFAARFTELAKPAEEEEVKEAEPVATS